MPLEVVGGLVVVGVLLIVEEELLLVVLLLLLVQIEFAIVPIMLVVAMVALQGYYRQLGERLLQFHR
jgi:hypothetical protein